jgi:hypothetical protein
MHPLHPSNFVAFWRDGNASKQQSGASLLIQSDAKLSIFDLTRFLEANR